MGKSCLLSSLRIVPLRFSLLEKGRHPFLSVGCGSCFGNESGTISLQVLIHRDRKSTRLNSSHVRISYAVFCLKKKTTKTNYITPLYYLHCVLTVTSRRIFAGLVTTLPLRLRPTAYEIDMLPQYRDVAADGQPA